MTERCEICARETCPTVATRVQLELVLTKRPAEVEVRTEAYMAARDACRQWLTEQPAEVLTIAQREEARKQRVRNAIVRHKPKPPGRFNRR